MMSATPFEEIVTSALGTTTTFELPLMSFVAAKLATTRLSTVRLPIVALARLAVAAVSVSPTVKLPTTDESLPSNTAPPTDKLPVTAMLP